MEQPVAFNFSNLQVGDEVVFKGMRFDVQGVVLKIYPHEVIMHWFDNENCRASIASILGTQVDNPSKSRSLEQEFFGGQFLFYNEVHSQGHLLLIFRTEFLTEESKDLGLEELAFMMIRRDGNVIFEAGDPTKG